MRAVNAPLISFAALTAPTSGASHLKLNEQCILPSPGLNVMSFSDYYPDGHQTGVTIILHGVRVAANGDLRLEASPGQWSPMPATGARAVDATTQTISRHLSFPDPSKDRTGFNPHRLPGSQARVHRQCDSPRRRQLPHSCRFRSAAASELCHQGWLQFRTFPRRSIRQVVVVAHESETQRLTLSSNKGTLTLLDGRGNLNNAWFIVRELVPAGAIHSAIEWTVTPNVIPGWKYRPVLQVSQLGYLTPQPKQLVIERSNRILRTSSWTQSISTG